MNIQIQFAFPYQGFLQQMVWNMPIEKMKDYCFTGVYTWESITRLHLTSSCQYDIPLVIINNGQIIAYFNFQRYATHQTYIYNAEMIVFSNLRIVMKEFNKILQILKNSFGIKTITFGTIEKSVADKIWQNICEPYSTHTFVGLIDNIEKIGILQNACLDMQQSIRNQNLWQIIL